MLSPSAWTPLNTRSTVHCCGNTPAFMYARSQSSQQASNVKNNHKMTQIWLVGYCIPSEWVLYFFTWVSMCCLNIFKYSNSSKMSSIQLNQPLWQAKHTQPCTNRVIGGWRNKSQTVIYCCWRRQLCVVQRFMRLYPPLCVSTLLQQIGTSWEHFSFSPLSIHTNYWLNSLGLTAHHNVIITIQMGTSGPLCR